MFEKTAELKKLFEEKISAVSATSEIEQLRIEFLGKKGSVAALMQELRNVPNDQKKEAGQAINETKQFIENAIAAEGDLAVDSQITVDMTAGDGHLAAGGSNIAAVANGSAIEHFAAGNDQLAGDHVNIALGGGIGQILCPGLGSSVDFDGVVGLGLIGASMAKAMSSSVLLLLWKYAFSRGYPASVAVRISPIDTTSTPIPSSFIIS